MLFASTEFVARIERAECSMYTQAHEFACDQSACLPTNPPMATPFFGGVVSYVAPDSSLNKVAGLGFEGVPSERDWDALESEFAKRSSPVQVELCTLADPAIGELLTRRER